MFTQLKSRWTGFRTGFGNKIGLFWTNARDVQECLGTIGELLRTILGPFRDGFPDLFPPCLGRVPRPFLSIFHPVLCIFLEF